MVDFTTQNYLALKKIYETASCMYQVLSTLVEVEENYDFIIAPDVVMPQPGFAESFQEILSDYFDKVNAVEKIHHIKFDELPQQTKDCLIDIDGLRSRVNLLSKNKLTNYTFLKNQVLCGQKLRIETLVHEDVFEGYYQAAPNRQDVKKEIGGGELTISSSKGFQSTNFDKTFYSVIQLKQHPVTYLIDFFKDLHNQLLLLDHHKPCGATILLALIHQGELYTLQFGDSNSYIFTNNKDKILQKAAPQHNFYHPFEFLRQYQIAHHLKLSDDYFKGYQKYFPNLSREKLRAKIIENLFTYHRNSFGLPVSRCFYSYKDLIEVGIVPDINRLTLDVSSENHILLTTDGVSEVVMIPDLINWFLVREQKINAQQMIDLAHTSGSRDNQTAVCFSFNEKLDQTVLLGVIDGFGDEGLYSQSTFEIALSRLEQNS